MYIIENDLLRISLHAKGAELTGIYHKQLDLEYLWNGDPSFWSKQSPVLFPIVGALKENTYYYRNHPYQLPRHGFAREKDFAVIEQTDESITFSLVHDAETLVAYPFEFELRVMYSLQQSKLVVLYEIKNPMNTELYFSIGGHPAFAVPLVEATEYTDYFLEFSSSEMVKRWPVSPDGLIDKGAFPFLDGQRINLSKDLFLHDALVFKDLRSDSVSLRCTKHSHGLDFNFYGFPYMGIWAAKNADFVCIEPWCGIADSVDADQQLKNKEGINNLEGLGTFKREWTITLY
jgi:galactose mutarotase-like enzyme